MAKLNKAAKIALAKRKAKKQHQGGRPATPDEILKDAFPQQRNFILDPEKLKAIFCTRRAAKSYTVGMYLVITALMFPNCNCLFIGLTRQSAKNIVWKDILKVLNRKYNLNAKFNQSELSMTFPNGSVIRVTGIDADEEEMNKLLGGKYRLACVDEASMYTVDMYNFIYGILQPAMTDPPETLDLEAEGEVGTICMTGTSSNFTRGLFYDITTGAEKGWSVHEWSAHDNPHVAKQWKKTLESIALNRPKYMETPKFKQWYLNMWVVDEDKLCYKFSIERNLCKEVPKQRDNSLWTYVLGIDLGWEDDNAFVLTGYHLNDPHLYILKTFHQNKLTFDEVVEVVRGFYRDVELAPHKIIVDGANKQGVESMKARSGMPFEYADKTGKADFIEMMNSDMVQGLIKYLPGTEDLWKQQLALVWKTEGDKIVLPKVENPKLPNHLCDAALYAWRNGFHYQTEPAKKVVPKYSKEWYEEQASGLWEREREAIERQSNNTEWAGAGEWAEA